MSKIKKEDVFDADYIAFIEKMNKFNREKEDIKELCDAFNKFKSTEEEAKRNIEVLKEEHHDISFTKGLAIGYVMSMIVTIIILSLK